MVKIAGMLIDTIISYTNADLEIIVPNGATMSDENINLIKNADSVEELDVNFGEVKGTRGVYVLLGWRSVERLGKDIRFRWQTYRTTDLDALRQENEDLTQALLELAEIVGGTENNG